ncbi:MAG: hypothetical protein WDN29_16360 [Methylovirgula sp.]
MDDQTQEAIAEGKVEGEWITHFNAEGKGPVQIADLQSLCLQADFEYGAGGQDLSLFIQTSLDGGRSVVDIAHLKFGKATARKIVGISCTQGHGPIGACDLTLPADTSVNFLGDRIRWVCIARGTYRDSSISMSVVPR